MMTCAPALAVSAWRREDVEPATREIMGVDIRQINHLGVYACRNVNNEPGRRPSAHARAAAIAVVGFELSDDRRITVADDWAGDTPAGRFRHRATTLATCSARRCRPTPIRFTPIICTLRLEQAASAGDDGGSDLCIAPIAAT
jgi:hypothetical protein